MKPFIKTASFKIRESALHLFDNGNGNLVIGFLLHHPAVDPIYWTARPGS
jgi:hypothetical protein